jgi:hypothetical protein
VTLPVDWLFTPNHTGLSESGAIGTGEQTLADFACTVALTVPGGLPEDGAFGAHDAEGMKNGTVTAEGFGARLRGHLLEDDRVEEVGLHGQTRVGVISLPVVMTPSDGPHRLSGPLTAELIEEIIADMGLEDGEET